MLATNCIANREFKVRQVCGRVTDKAGATIPDVRVELLDANSSVIQRVQTDAKGELVFASVSNGKYILRIEFDVCDRMAAVPREPFQARWHVRRTDACHSRSGWILPQHRSAENDCWR
jgi:hypothetical protein